MRDLVAVSALQSLLDPRRVNFDAEKNGTVHRRGERLRTTDAAEAAGQNKLAFERSAEMFSSGGGKRFESALNNSLTADVNPRTGSHLPVHGQAKSLKSIELSVIVPIAHQI